MDKTIWDRYGFADNRGMNREKDPRLKLIHENFFNCITVIRTPLDKFRAIGGLVNREKIKERPENTTCVTTLVLKNFSIYF